jgi:hypothetical protein
LTLEQIQAQNEAQLRLEKLENISRNVAANGAFEIIDVSRESIKEILEPSLVCYYFYKLGISCFSKGQEDLYVVLGF